MKSSTFKLFLLLHLIMPIAVLVAASIWSPWILLMSIYAHPGAGIYGVLRSYNAYSKQFRITARYVTILWIVWVLAVGAIIFQAIY